MNENIIYKKLDNFISSYYKNQLLKGFILTVIFVALLFLVVSLGEYFFSFSSFTRSFIFYFLIVFYLSLIFYFILLPTTKVFRLSKGLSYKQAAGIISGKFSGINDKLINLLELIGIEGKNNYSKALTIASINQKTTALRDIQFTEALDKQKNFEFLKYLGLLLFAFLIIFIFKPDVITQSTNHIINYEENFVHIPELNFEILNENLNVEKGQDFKLNLRVGGDFLPDKLKVNFGGNSFFMEKTSDNEFSYTLKNLNNSLSLFFSSGKYSSENYKLNVLPTPIINNLNISVFPPAYTGEEAKTLSNIGDLTLLSGSIVKWEVETNNANFLYFMFSDSSKIPALQNSDFFTYKKRFVKSEDYSVSIKNDFFEKDNYLKYSVKVIPDLYPGIELEKLNDSTNFSVVHFRGNINDDYGFSSLKFNYIVIENEKKSKIKSLNIDFNKNLKSQNYYFTFDFSSLELMPDQNIEYYFSVKDNDKPNGYKESKTEIEYFEVPSKQELDDFENAQSEKVKSKTEESNKLIKELQKDIKKLKESLINEKTTDWEKTKMLNDINQKNNELKDLLKQISEENKEKNEFMNSFTEKQEEIMKKQEEIQQLLDELMTDELKDLMEQIEQLENEMDENEMKRLSDKMEMTYKEIEEQLDRNMELLKRFEVEQKMEETAEELNDLAEEQKELAEKLDKKELTKEDGLKKQNEIKKELERVEEKHEKTMELNEDLKKSFKLDDFKEEFEEISKEMENSEQNMSDNKKQKTQKSMQQSAKEMQELAEKMQSMMQQSMDQQAGEDIESMRLMLKNLITFSKAQEELISKFSKVSNLDPKFTEYVNEQNKIKEDFQVVEDSLLALSKRVIQIDKVVNTEVKSINYNMKLTLSLLEDSRRSGYKKRQQTIMASANNLALLISEVIQSMQDQMSQSKGSGEGKSGKKKKPSLGEMQDMQQGLKEMMEKYLESLKKGKGKGGKQQTQGLGKMLAKQEVMKKMLQDLKNGSSTGTKTQEFLKQIEQLMNQTEDDIINRNVSAETLARQKKIMNKLLEAENSEKEKDKEKKRKSKEARNYKISAPEYFKDENYDKNSIKEDLEISNLKLYHYYNELYKNYKNSLNK